MTDKLNVMSLEAGEYESYRLLFKAASPSVFVDDLRSNDDNSLALVPRITTFEQLKSIFKLDVDRTLGYNATPDGGMYWAIIGFYIRTGIAAFVPKVFDQNGKPLPSPGTYVFAHWPGAPNHDPLPNPNYHNNAVGGFTNGEGDIGFGYSGGAVTGGDGGVYDIWVSADPPQGTRFFSDLAIRLGWFGGTDHLTANPIFQAVRKTGVAPLPGSGDELRVFDNSGALVGRVPLVNGGGSGGRIGLFSGEIERGYVEFVK